MGGLCWWLLPSAANKCDDFGAHAGHLGWPRFAFVLGFALYPIKALDLIRKDRAG